MRNMVENGGNKRKALREAGYSESVANNPDKVFSSPAVVEQLNRGGLTQKAIAKRVLRLMDSEDERVQLRAVDMACKLLGLYAAAKVELEQKETPEPFSLWKVPQIWHTFSKVF